MTTVAKRSWREKILQEMKSLLVIALYLWLVLAVSQLHRGIILAEHNIPYSYAQGLIFALINAWVLAKFVLVGEGLGVGKRWRHLPLLYFILLKSAVFAAILMLCHIIERTLTTMWRAGSLAAGLPDQRLSALMDGLTTTLIVFITLIPFFATRELSRVLGKDELHSLLRRREV